MSIWYWIAFFIIIGANIAIDLFFSAGKNLTLKKSVLFTSVWVAIALAFGGVLAYNTGYSNGIEFFTGYLVELSLSLDNVFIFLLIFKHFAIPVKYQHRILFWGVLGAIIMRLIMISMGVYLIQQFEFIFFFFGALLLYSAFKLSQPETDFDFKDSKLLKVLQKYIPITHKIHRDKFIISDRGKRYFTPMAVVLVLIEQADLVFAIDSIPAVMAITQNTFIIFTSNIFAILGLRSMYFLLASVVERFVYLHTALMIILGYIGIKMILVPLGIHIPTLISLLVIFLSLSGAIAASALRRG